MKAGCFKPGQSGNPRTYGQPLTWAALLWTGESKPKTVISHWQSCLKRLFEFAEIEGDHARRFRDTFAVELLLQRVPI